MSYTREDFETGKCPNCGSKNISEEGNLANVGFLNGAGYFLNFPFGADYTCEKCGAQNDEDDCFVATAVYGDRNAPQVETLREFRDNVLMKSNLGRAFVAFYYSGAGKKSAQFIQKHAPQTIPVIRKGLDFLVDRYSAQKTD